jgi:hypothetical protein
MMNEHGKSDRPVVPVKSSNKAGQPAAEGMEGRGLTKGNPQQQNASRTQCRTNAPSALERIRQAASRDKEVRFTALFHHIYVPEALRTAYLSVKREAAPGVDGETWRHYGEALEANLQNLSHRLKQGAYRAKPVRRVYIPKADGRLRPLGVTALEDKIVQRAAVEVMNAIYETDFLGFSYGFRPKRSQHNALDALYTGLLTKKVNWVLDLDIRCFFRCDFARMACQVHRASHRGPARRAAHPEVVERGRAGGWETNPYGGRDASGRQCVAAVGEYLSPLRVRSVGSGMASKAGARRCNRRAIRGRYRGWVPE